MAAYKPRSRKMLMSQYEPPAMDEKRKLMVITEGKDRFELTSYQYASPDSLVSKKVVKDLREVDTSTSFIQVSHYVFMVGGMSFVNESLTRVLVYDEESCRMLPMTPSLNSGKSLPVLVALGGKLFAFSRVLGHSMSSYLEEDPKCEVLEVETLGHPNCRWTPQPMIELPPPEMFDLRAFFIIGYAAFSSSLFLSLAGYLSTLKGVCSLSYNDTTKQWCFSKHPLPFYGEARFQDGILYAFPSHPEKKNQICSYQLLKEEDNDGFLFVELASYVICSGSHLSMSGHPYLRTLIPMEKNVICIVEARVEGVYDMPIFQANYLGVDVIKLVPLVVYTRKNRKVDRGRNVQSLQGSSHLLWHKSYGRKWPIYGNCF